MKRFAATVSALFTAMTNLQFSVDRLDASWAQTFVVSWVGDYDEQGFHGPRYGISVGIGTRAFTLHWS